MDETKKTTVEMTAEDAAQFAAFKAEQEKKARQQQRKENRAMYAQLVDEQVALAIPELMSLSEQIKTVKNTVFGNFKSVLDIKADVMSLTKEGGQHSHTFTTSDGNMRITLGCNTIDAYRDTVEDGIAMVRSYIESLAKDDNSRALVNAVMRLLARDQKGTLKASRVLQLRKMADESGDETFQEGVRIIEESYQPTETKLYIRAEFKDDKGWHIIPLSVTDA
jgi:hypothetical protein|nr:MAG TPA: Protein of unknown function (DUF3164) [Caudoviricetes sp.]